MNERIEQLAKQASKLVRAAHPELVGGMTASQIAKSNVKTYMITEYDLDKFAELIVEECAYAADYLSSPGQTQGTVIKRHFGIKE